MIDLEPNKITVASPNDNWLKNVMAAFDKREAIDILGAKFFVSRYTHSNEFDGRGRLHEVTAWLTPVTGR